MATIQRPAATADCTYRSQSSTGNTAPRLGELGLRPPGQLTRPDGLSQRDQLFQGAIRKEELRRRLEQGPPVFPGALQVRELKSPLVGPICPRDDLKQNRDSSLGLSQSLQTSEKVQQTAIALRDDDGCIRLPGSSGQDLDGRGGSALAFGAVPPIFELFELKPPVPQPIPGPRIDGQDIG